MERGGWKKTAFLSNDFLSHISHSLRICLITSLLSLLHRAHWRACSLMLDADITQGVLPALMVRAVRVILPIALPLLLLYASLCAYRMCI